MTDRVIHLFFFPYWITWGKINVNCGQTEWPEGKIKEKNSIWRNLKYEACRNVSNQRLLIVEVCRHEGDTRRRYKFSLSKTEKPKAAVFICLYVDLKNGLKGSFFYVNPLDHLGNRERTDKRCKK